MTWYYVTYVVTETGIPAAPMGFSSAYIRLNDPDALTIKDIQKLEARLPSSATVLSLTPLPGQAEIVDGRVLG